MPSQTVGVATPPHRDGGVGRSQAKVAHASGAKTSKMPYDPIRDRDNPKSGG